MPIVNPIWFYLGELFGDLDFWSVILGIICGVVTGICFYCSATSYGEEKNFYCKASKKFGIATIIFVALGAVVPSYTTIKEMAVASVVTYENVEAVKGEATDLIDYIIDSVDKLNDSKECE